MSRCFLSSSSRAYLYALFRIFASLLILNAVASAQEVFEYPYGPYNRGAMDPQLTGWPLSKEERSYVLLAEFERRPGREANQHLPQLWPRIPSAGFWGGSSWLDTHVKLVNFVQANRGPCDVLLVGDSITQQWGSPLDQGLLNEAWKKHFASLRTINIGIGGDKIQNVLWRIDHGGVEGIEPRTIVLMIGNNNMFFAPETGVEAVARGIEVVLANLRKKFDVAHVVVVKILPAHAPGNPFYDNIKKTNASLDSLRLDDDAKVHVLDLTADFLHPDGTLKSELFSQDNIHLSLAGYAVYAEKLKPLLDKFVGTKGLGPDIVLPR
ncbi:MAG: GDSL-type esterase/lipase family protein [Planctomycetota bacterium]|nr:GDSL-type esterase/lipase family protein [Planctomycetota bacterium]